jgi:hypothetical protein
VLESALLPAGRSLPVFLEKPLFAAYVFLPRVDPLARVAVFHRVASDLSQLRRLSTAAALPTRGPGASWKVSSALFGHSAFPRRGILPPRLSTVVERVVDKTQERRWEAVRVEVETFHDTDGDGLQQGFVTALPRSGCGWICG